MTAKTTWKEIRDRRITTEQDERDVRRYYDLHELALRLAETRKRLGVTQARLAEDLEVSQANVSRIEKERDLKLSTIDGYVTALGGRLELRAVFPDDDAVVLAGDPFAAGAPAEKVTPIGSATRRKK